MNAIRIKNLSKTFTAPHFSGQKPCHALRQISIEVRSGSIYTLLGPNGAGKTTLIRILAGLIPGTSGTSDVNGKVGLLMSGVQGFWGVLDGRANLEYFCALQNIVGRPARKKIEEMTDTFRMGAYIRKPVHAYSSGMKHRLVLARTLLNDPDILLLDEPATYLDPIGAREFHLLLRDHLCRKLGKTVFLSTHQLEEAQEISDTLGFLYQGKLLWEKNAELFRSRRADLLEDYLRTARDMPA